MFTHNYSLSLMLLANKVANVNVSQCCQPAISMSWLGKSGGRAGRPLIPLTAFRSCLPGGWTPPYSQFTVTARPRGRLFKGASPLFFFRSAGRLPPVKFTLPSSSLALDPPLWGCVEAVRCASIHNLVPLPRDFSRRSFRFALRSPLNSTARTAFMPSAFTPKRGFGPPWGVPSSRLAWGRVVPPLRADALRVPGRCRLAVNLPCTIIFHATGTSGQQMNMLPHPTAYLPGVQQWIELLINLPTRRRNRRRMFHVCFPHGVPFLNACPEARQGGSGRPACRSQREQSSPGYPARRVGLVGRVSEQKARPIRAAVKPPDAWATNSAYRPSVLMRLPCRCLRQRAGSRGLDSRPGRAIKTERGRLSRPDG